MASNISRGGADSTARTNLTEKAWAKTLLSETIRKFPLKPYVGTGSNMPIQKNTEFTRKAGNTFYLGLSMQLAGNPITGDGERAGNEIPLAIYDDSVTVDQMAQGVIIQGRMEEQRYSYNLRKEGRDKLSDYFALAMDEIIIGHICGRTSITLLGASSTIAFPAAGTVPTSNRRYAVNGKTVIAPTDGSGSEQTNVLAADKMDVETIRVMQYKAYNATRKLPPLAVNGAEKYLFIISPSSLFWLESDSVYQQMLRDAQVRGDSNPLFTGAIADIHGCIIRKHERINDETNGTNNVSVNVLVGAQAGIMAMVDTNVQWHEELVDRGNKYSIWGAIIWGIKKSKFNSEDFSTYVCYSGSPTPVETA